MYQTEALTLQETFIKSKILGRNVKARILGQGHFHHPHCIFILFNDGQDFPLLHMQRSVDAFNKIYDHCKIAVCGLDCGDRINEYGAVARLDYRNRGSKAIPYHHSLISEILPLLKQKYHFNAPPDRMGFAGFSLGGLSAFDFTVRHPELMSFCGVFSGSFWWRHKPFTADTPDDFRIMHETIEKLPLDFRQKYWFEAGTRDELSDRNHNGVIDSIDDTLHLIDTLIHRGFDRSNSIEYMEVAGGTHDPYTWGHVMPYFFDWIQRQVRKNIKN
ncbi:MAG TPA: alpha/beta hydrolase-fold protein [Saprospiraceae bacterium]|nr:alpha/beta hydrolase-fold protein [Saprospiraceae bacterium]HQW56216.1 alpha/beta hydrolase-fold protein [Saprospiraceae bacterium]